MFTEEKVGMEAQPAPVGMFGEVPEWDGEPSPCPFGPEVLDGIDSRCPFTGEVLS